MDITRRTFTAAAAATLAAPHITLAQSSGPTLRIETMANGFDEPWAVGFLPDSGILVTERPGTLVLIDKGKRRSVAGLPAVANIGQGGLLDVLVPRDHAQSGHIFMTYAKPRGRSGGTAVMRARLDRQTARLSDVRTIFEMRNRTRGGRHFGSRIVESPGGELFVSIGDRGDDAEAQNRASHNGTIIRITRDGRIPSGNPFAQEPDTFGEIWSYGHRNPQGLTLDLEGNLWAVEHGAKGGDEINRITKGANYGWPVISYGTEYSGRKIGEGTAKAGMEQPDFYWDPSIAPSGYMIYSGALWPEWRGQHFVGSLKFDYIARLSTNPLRETEQIKSEQTNRVRDIREAPDGTIWFLSASDGTLCRISPTA